MPLQSRNKTEIANNYAEAIQLLLKDKFLSLSANLNADDLSIIPNEETPEIALYVIPQDIHEFLQTRHNTAPGYDNIRYKHLQIINLKYPNILADMVQACFQFQIFPNLLKRANLSFYF